MFDRIHDVSDIERIRRDVEWSRIRHDRLGWETGGDRGGTDSLAARLKAWVDVTGLARGVIASVVWR